MLSHLLFIGSLSLRSKNIGECKSKQEEDKILAQEVATLKVRFTETLTQKKMKEALVRLMYAEMLGRFLPLTTRPMRVRGMTVSCFFLRDFHACLKSSCSGNTCTPRFFFTLRFQQCVRNSSRIFFSSSRLRRFSVSWLWYAKPLNSR